MIKRWLTIDDVAHFYKTFVILRSVNGNFIYFFFFSLIYLEFFNISGLYNIYIYIFVELK